MSWKQCKIPKWAKEALDSKLNSGIHFNGVQHVGSMKNISHVKGKSHVYRATVNENFLEGVLGGQNIRYYEKEITKRKK